MNLKEKAKISGLVLTILLSAGCGGSLKEIRPKEGENRIPLSYILRSSFAAGVRLSEYKRIRQHIYFPLNDEAKREMDALIELLSIYRNVTKKDIYINFSFYGHSNINEIKKIERSAEQEAHKKALHRIEDVRKYLGRASAKKRLESNIKKAPGLTFVSSKSRSTREDQKVTIEVRLKRLD